MDILKIDRSQEGATEYLGTKPKFWFFRDGMRWLFKADNRGTGEDWAEIIVSAICRELDLPHVAYELAEVWHEGERQQYGVVCRNIAPEPINLILGNQLLFERDPSYPAQDRYHMRQHTFDAVCQVLKGLQPPGPDWMPNPLANIATAVDVFAGYVVLDALVANQDRHHENWGAIRNQDTRLAPTFDHGASLARNITDGERTERLTTNDRNRQLEAMCRKARSAIYANSGDRKAMGTFDLLARFDGEAPMAVNEWQKRAAEIQATHLEAIISSVPATRMSELAKRFTLQLLLTNQQRIRQNLEK